jgi:hypothetical protein
MRGLPTGAQDDCMETTYLTYLSQAQSGSLAGPPLEWPRTTRRAYRRRRHLFR